MLSYQEILDTWKAIKSLPNGRDLQYAYYFTEHKLPKDIKQTLQEAFPGPQSLGYQNPIDLLEVARYIAAQAIQINKKEIKPFNLSLPGFFRAIHHDHNESITPTIIGIIESEIGKIDWEANINYFDGRIYNSKNYAYIEAGWILAHKVRNFIYTSRIKQLWLFPYEIDYDVLAPYYFIIKRMNGWERIQDEDTAWLKEVLKRIEK